MSAWQLAAAIQELYDKLEAIHGAALDGRPDDLKEVIYVHAGLAALSGLVPVPGADLVLGAANVWTMYARINGLIGLKFSDHVIKTLASGVIANVGGAIALMMLAASASKLLIGFGSIVGGVTLGALLAGATLVMAMIYLKSITYLVEKTGGLNFTEADLKEAAEEQTPPKSMLKDIVKENIPSKEELGQMTRLARKHKDSN